MRGPPMRVSEGKPAKKPDDAAEAVRFMIIKAAIFIVVPLIAAVVAALWVLM